jgi:NADPH-dependent 2,4-dienoyl-CoA reductase/sulfur reductase-like enzyme
MIGAERHPPYDRPPLTKKFMTGEIDGTSLRADFAALGVDLRLGETATGLRDGVLGTDQAEYRFDALVVATGATPVQLPGPGPQRVLRTIDDAAAIRSALRPGLKLAVVGAGWIGAELATSAAKKGCQVTVLEAAPAPLAGALGAEAGSRTVPWYSAAGVELRLGQPVESVEPGGVAGSGVVLENGVAVDEGLRASVPGVFAAGDCAAFRSRRFGGRIRVEHWDTAIHAPEVVAANILGGGELYDPVPYFWSEQFGRMVQYVGHHGAGDQLIWRGDPAGKRWGACWVSPEADSGARRLVAVMTVGQPRDMLQGRRVIEAGGPVDPGRLADPGVPMRDAVAG